MDGTYLNSMDFLHNYHVAPGALPTTFFQHHQHHHQVNQPYPWQFPHSTAMYSNPFYTGCYAPPTTVQLIGPFINNFPAPAMANSPPQQFAPRYCTGTLPHHDTSWVQAATMAPSAPPQYCTQRINNVKRQKKKKKSVGVVDADGNNIPRHDGPSAEYNPMLAERFKTALCVNLINHGTCPYRGRCMFAHGKKELRTPTQNQREGLTSERAIESFKEEIRTRKAAKLDEQQQPSVQQESSNGSASEDGRVERQAIGPIRAEITGCSSQSTTVQLSSEVHQPHRSAVQSVAIPCQIAGEISVVIDRPTESTVESGSKISRSKHVVDSSSTLGNSLHVVVNPYAPSSQPQNFQPISSPVPSLDVRWCDEHDAPLPEIYSSFSQLQLISAAKRTPRRDSEVGSSGGSGCEGGVVHLLSCPAYDCSKANFVRNNSSWSEEYLLQGEELPAGMVVVRRRSVTTTPIGFVNGERRRSNARHLEWYPEEEPHLYVKELFTTSDAVTSFHQPVPDHNTPLSQTNTPVLDTRRKGKNPSSSTEHPIGAQFFPHVVDVPNKHRLENFHRGNDDSASTRDMQVTGLHPSPLNSGNSAASSRVSVHPVESPLDSRDIFSTPLRGKQHDPYLRRDTANSATKCSNTAAGSFSFVAPDNLSAIFSDGGKSRSVSSTCSSQQQDDREATTSPRNSHNTTRPKQQSKRRRHTAMVGVQPIGANDAPQKTKNRKINGNKGPTNNKFS